MSKYESLDKAILNAITHGTDRLMVMEHNTALIHETAPFVDRNTLHFRVLDRRLQALRKAGKIAHDGKRWHVLGVSE